MKSLDKLNRSWLMFASVLTMMAGPVSAQITASISGKVQDATSSGVPNAAVSVKHVETGFTRESITDETGNYRVLSLPLGQVEVRAQKSGFKAAVRTGVNLAVGQEAVVNLQLEVGDIVQQVTVSAESPLINTTTAPVSGLVGEREVKELPLNGRSFDNLITLNPGTINYGLRSANTSTSNGNTFSVAGRRPLENLFLLNGVEYTGSSQLAITPGGVSGDLLGIDAVREFNVLTETYSAEYGKRAGAQITVVTQSGSNAVHGSLFEFLRNSALDARNFFDQGSIAPFRRNQFGGALGGPVKKDKLFLFGNYEGFRHRLGISNVAVVPDALARQGSLPNAQGAYVAVQNLNRAMLPYTSLWPVANGPELLVGGLPTGTALSYSNPRQAIREDFGTARGDYTLRTKDTLSAAYTVDDGDNISPAGDPLFGAVNVLRMQVASLQETHIFSPSVLNLFTAGFSRAAFNYDPYTFATFPPELSFVKGGPPGGIVIGGGVSTSTAAAITSAGPNNSANVWNRRNLWTYSDGLQISRRKHQIRVGVWFQRMQDNENTASTRLGQATFASLTTFLQGTVTSFQVVPNPTELGWRSLFGAWYVQDSYKLFSNLTLQVGLRHEFTTGYNEVSGRGANYVTGADGLLVTTPRVADSLFSENKAQKLFGPRVGLAWDPFKNGRTAVRAGFGTYYTLIDNLAFLVNSIPPFNGPVSFTNASLFSFLPVIPNTPVPASCGPGVPTPCTTYAARGVQQDAKTPTVQEWNFTLEQQLAGDLALRVAYVGSFGYHGLLSLDPNSIPAQICATATCVTGGTPGTTRGSVTQGAQYIPIATRPNPYLSAGFFWFTEGNSSYNGLQTDVTKRFSHGVQFRFNYTWSKNLDLNSSLTGAQSSNQAQFILDRNDLHRDWGPSALNVKHQASVSGRYELPFGRGRRWATSGLANRLAGGWQVSGIAMMLSGFPFTPQLGANRSGNGDTRNPDRPSLNPAFNGNVILGKQTQWFDPNAFILPAVGTWGNLGRGGYSGPGLANLDLSLLKNTALTERVNLQFRAEFFNTLNHTNLGTPNAIAFTGATFSSAAGLISSTATTSRQIQFGLKLVF